MDTEAAFKSEGEERDSPYLATADNSHRYSGVECLVSRERNGFPSPASIESWISRTVLRVFGPTAATLQTESRKRPISRRTWRPVLSRRFGFAVPANVTEGGRPMRRPAIACRYGAIT